jgi:hypothetical protein
VANVVASSGVLRLAAAEVSEWVQPCDCVPQVEVEVQLPEERRGGGGGGSGGSGGPAAAASASSRYQGYGSVGDGARGGRPVSGLHQHTHSQHTPQHSVLPRRSSE